MTSVISRGAHWHRPLMYLAGAMAVTSAVSTAGLLLDNRVLLSSPIWLKPFKFSVSIGVYAVTLAWLLQKVRRAPRLMWWVGTVISATAVVEMVIIIGQVVRGQPSHFNASTPFNTALFAVMGASITALWVMTLIVAIGLFRQKLSDEANAAAIRWGIVLALVGMALAFLMTGPTPDQLAQLRSGNATPLIGAHSVGVRDGGPGMPLTGWSTTGGDLRIPHFVGIHALQALPLFALALRLGSGRVNRLRDMRVRARLVRIAAVFYAGVLALTTWQALRGQPLTSPDTWTLGAAAILAAATAIGVGVGVAMRPNPVLNAEVPA